MQYLSNLSKRSLTLNMFEGRPGLLCLVSLLAFGTLNTNSQPLQDLITGNIQLHNATFGLYDAKKAAPAGLVRIERSYTDYQRKGFLRIGILPIFVLEGVTVEFQGDPDPSDTLVRLRQWLGDDGTSRLEVRRLRIQWTGVQTNYLEAGLGLLGPSGRLDLANGVRLRKGDEFRESSRATLQIYGHATGELAMKTESPWKGNLFAPALPAALETKPR
jgi:hypothetical protein